MVEAYKKAWKNFANFNDRASRADYWWFTLAQALIGVVFSVLVLIGGDSFWPWCSVGFLACIVWQVLFRHFLFLCAGFMISISLDGGI